TSKDHNFCPGDTVEKQIIVINNSRETIVADCRWSLDLPPRRPFGGRADKIRVSTGQQERIPFRIALPSELAPGRYKLRAEVSFSNGETQNDSFAIDVLPKPAARPVARKIALFDPKGETAKLLKTMAIDAHAVEADADLSGYEILIVGKG